MCKYKYINLHISLHIRLEEASWRRCKPKYVHVELALCFLVTNYVYPNKIDRLTYDSIAKVIPVLSEKSP